jgi:hypothetical protein
MYAGHIGGTEFKNIHDQGGIQFRLIRYGSVFQWFRACAKQEHLLPDWLAWLAPWLFCGSEAERRLVLKMKGWIV